MNLPLTFDEYQKIYSKVPRLTLELIVKKENGLVLSLRSAYGWENHWHIPGGVVHYGERVKDAAKRIAKDELNAEISVGQVIGYIEYPSEKKEMGFGSTVGVAILCEYISGELKPDNNSKEVKIFNELPDNLIEEQKIFLEENYSKIFS